MTPRAVLFAVLLLASSCAKPIAQTYRLTPNGTARILVPPGVATPETTRATLALPATKARTCTPAAGPIAVEKRGAKLRLTVDRDALAQQSPGWLRQWTAELESQGCIPHGAAADLADRVLESVPLDPSTAYGLLHADSVQRGFVELGPENRLQTQAPILKSGKSGDANVIDIASVTGHGNTLDVDIRESEDVIGVETAWYTLRPKPGAGTTIVPISAERRVEDQITPIAAPTGDYFRFAPVIGFYRLIYKADIDAKGSVTEIVVGAPDRLELERRTSRVLGDFDTCKVSDPNLCAVIPRHVALNPVLAVTVNGQEVRVGIRGTVRSAIAQGHGPRRAEEVLPTLTVRKPYGNKLVEVEFDRATPAILDMILLGGESISWK
jgi:hypothetical protein